jgi:N4-gp56 family major capsid protein
MNREFTIFPIVLNMFDNTNVTTDAGMTPEMREYYDMTLITTAEPELVHDQFAQMRNIPQHNGNKIKFRKYASLPKALTPLTEGVTPKGSKLSVTEIEATVHQYGNYIETSDLLELEAIDNNLTEATKILGSQAGRTLDTVTREVLNGGTNVQYGEGSKAFRHLLVGGDATAANNDYLTVRAVRKGVRTLSIVNAPKPDGKYYAGIIHPDTKFDIMDDDDWKYPHQYVDTSELYDNEIGCVGGVRWTESTEAKVFHAEDFSYNNCRTMTVNGAVTNSNSVNVDGATIFPSALVGRYVLVNGVKAKVTANTASTLTLDTNVTAADNDTIYPGEAGAEGRDIYSTLILGANAYGTTSIDGGGLTHIVKQLGSAGTADPLNQRATVGWKAIKTAVRLVEEYMVRIETASTFEVGAN